MLRIYAFSTRLLNRSNGGSHLTSSASRQNFKNNRTHPNDLLFARLFSTSHLQCEKQENENYINRLIERKKLYDQQQSDRFEEDAIKKSKKDPWSAYKNTDDNNLRVRTSEGFNKERRSRNNEKESESAEESGQRSFSKENPMDNVDRKKLWRVKLQEKRDKIVTRHGKLVSPEDLEVHYKNKKVNEIKIYGKNACLTIFETRKEDIIKCLITADLLEDLRFRPLFKYMAERKLTYRAVEEDELRAYADSIHHEGIVLVTKRPEVLDVDQSIEMIISKWTNYTRSKRARNISNLINKNRNMDAQDENEDEIQREEFTTENNQDPATTSQKWDYQTIAMLENVQNPHNLGALVRVLAFFGIKIAFVANLDAYKEAKPEIDDSTPSWKLKKMAQDFTEVQSPTVYRLAQGGMEHVTVVPILSPEEFSRILYKLKRRGDYKIVATSSTAPRKDSLWDDRVMNELHDKNRILLFGSESEGLSQRVLNSADYIVEVPGAGNIESLNVATSAAAVLTMLNRPFK